MKKLVLTLALVFGMLTANAQFFVGGQFGLTYDGDTENTTFRIAPSLAMRLTMRGPLPDLSAIHTWTTTIRFTLLLMLVGPSSTKVS